MVDEVLQKEGLEMGAAAYFTKPLDIEILINMVNEILGKEQIQIAYRVVGTPEVEFSFNCVWNQAISEANQYCTLLFSYFLTGIISNTASRWSNQIIIPSKKVMPNSTGDGTTIIFSSQNLFSELPVSYGRRYV